MTKRTKRIPSVCAAIMLSGIWGEVFTDVILDVQGGQLFGARNVPVGSLSFNVEFVDGTCAAVFNGCDEASDFAFSTLADARLAGESLLAKVFLDVVTLGNFDSEPLLTNGCGPTPNLARCIILIPYELDTPPPPETLHNRAGR